jgi:hypothetical protein
MLKTLQDLNYLIVLGVAVAGFLLGWLWYSPLLFGKAWMKEMGLTKADCQKMPKSKGVMMMGGGFLLTVVSTAVLAVLITEHQMLVAGHPSLGAVGGAKVGLFVGAGLVAVRDGVNHIFSMKSLKLYCIIAGHDIALCAVQGALLGQFLWPK